MTRRQEIEGRVALIKKLAVYLRTNRIRLVSELWGGLVAYASSLIETVTDGRLSMLRREDNGDFFVTETLDGIVNSVPSASCPGRSGRSPGCPCGWPSRQLFIRPECFY